MIAEHMQAFVVDLGGAPILALRHMEKRMHDLVGAFNLKRKSDEMVRRALRRSLG